MADKETKIDLDLPEDMQDEDITLSTTELDDIMQSAELTEEGDPEELQLEKYGVWVKVKPESIGAPAGEEVAFQLTDLDKDQDSRLSREEEDLLSELEEEMGGQEPGLVADLESFEEQAAESGAAGENVDELLEDLPPLEEPSLEEPPLEEPSLEEPSTEESLEETPAAAELPAVEEELELEAAPGEDRRVEAPASGAIDSASILQRIEQELQSIKLELFELKQELSGFSRGAEDKAMEPAPDVEVEPVVEDTRGFFDEEEDETIALTGDELDNILNTADVTEEISEAAAAPAEPPEEGLSLEAEEPGLLVDREDLLDLQAEEPPASKKPGAEGRDAAETVPPLEGAAAEPEEISIELVKPEPGGPQEPETIEVPSFEEEIREQAGEEQPGASPLDRAPAAEAPAGEMPLEMEESGTGGFSLDESMELELAEEELAPVEELLRRPSLEDLSIEEPPAAEAPTGEDAGAIEELLEPSGPAEEALPALDEAGEVELEPEEQIPGIPDSEAIPQPLGDLDLAGEEELILEEEPMEPAPLEAEGMDALAEEGEIEIELDKPVPGLEEAAEPVVSEPAAGDSVSADLPGAGSAIPADLQSDIKSVLMYLDQLLEALPEEKIREFANSEYFGTYKRLFEELGLAD